MRNGKKFNITTKNNSLNQQNRNRPVAISQQFRPFRGEHSVSFAPFTLLELLVVIAIIAILAAILIPTLGMARERAYVAQCVSNFKQMGNCLHLYAADYNDMFPSLTGIDAATGEVQVNVNQFYGLHILLMRDYLPRGRVTEEGVTDQGWTGSIAYDKANWVGKNIPVSWMCPSVSRVARSRATAMPNSSRVFSPYDKGLVDIRNAGVFKASGSYRRHPRYYPENTPAANRLGRLPNPERYAYMFEPGWEPMTLDAWSSFEKTPYTYYPECKLDGTVRWGHPPGWSVAFIDGHVKFAAKKRLNTVNGNMENQKFLNRCVNLSDL